MAPIEKLQGIVRLSLYRKIVGAFVLLTILMMLGNVTLLLQLKPVYAIDQSEFTGSQLTQDLIDAFQARLTAADSCLAGRDYGSKLAFFSSRINSLRDSLHRMDLTDDLRTRYDSVFQSYDAFDSVIQARISGGSHSDPPGESLLSDPATGSLLRQFRSIQLTYHRLLMRDLQSRQAEISTGWSTAFIVLILTFIIAMVITWFVARELTRPILALKAGTEKVGEGKYITVPVSSNDEIADLTQAFNLMSDKLRQLDEMRAQLMSEISHEMRTPLQVIKAGCYSIMHTKDGPQLTQRQRDAVGMIHQATNRINQFVNSFLDIAKMEAGLMKFSFEPMNLVDVLNPLIQEAQLIAQTRQIQLGLTCAEVPPVLVDRERLSQVFSNLLSNALKYTPDNGSIRVTISKAPPTEGIGSAGQECVRVDVTDTGVGIPEADLGKLFSKFYQAKNTPLVNEKGSGLGLALVKYVVEAHGGRVSVTSRVGEGSTFSILLPA